MTAKKIALAFGLAIVLPSMIHFGVETITPKPKWRDYQVEDYYPKYQKATPEEKIKLDKERKAKEADRLSQEKKFQQLLYFIAVPIGIAAIIFGACIPCRAIGAGLMFGGIFCVGNGFINYWNELSEILKFISALLTFIVLMVVGYTKIEKDNCQSKNDKPCC